MLVSDAKLVFLDLETTGLSPAMGDRVIEIGLVVCRGDHEPKLVRQLINPRRPIPAEVQGLHGICDDDVRGCPIFPVIATQLCHALRSAWVVGHNLRFDLGFLAMELALAGRTPETAGCLDTCQLAATAWELPNYKLDTLISSLGIPRGEAHRALDDAIACKLVFDRVVAELGGPAALETDDLEALHKYVPAWPPDPRRSLPGPMYDALTSGRPISIRYVNGDGQASARIVRPCACFPAGRQLYIRAYCNQSEQLRTFRLDRIVEVAEASRP